MPAIKAKDDQAMQDALAKAQACYDDWLKHPFTAAVLECAIEKELHLGAAVLSATDPKIADDLKRHYLTWKGLANGDWYRTAYSAMRARVMRPHLAAGKLARDSDRSAT